MLIKRNDLSLLPKFSSSLRTNIAFICLRDLLLRPSQNGKMYTMKYVTYLRYKTNYFSIWDEQ